MNATSNLKPTSSAPFSYAGGGGACGLVLPDPIETAEQVHAIQDDLSADVGTRVVVSSWMFLRTETAGR